MSATPARQAALRVLRAVRAGELADRALRRELADLPETDRAWTQELVQGTLRLRGRLDHRLGRFTRRPLTRLEPDVLDVLRLGAYQLTEMGAVPAYAAVSQSVELVKPSPAAGLVNGILQSLRREGEAVEFPSFEDDPVAHLSTWGSHPRWLVERWITAYGTAGARALVESNNTRPALHLQPLMHTTATAVAILAAAGIEAEVVPLVESVRLRRPQQVAEALRQLPAIVQDPAASAVVRYVAAPAGAVVADLCAAPGGKAIGIAAGLAACATGRVIAADTSVGRLLRLARNLERLPPLPVALLVADARMPPIRSADVVLIDVPCTGTGTLRRHADGRWRISQQDLAGLVLLQAQILEAAAALVRAGGLLVYATCSLEPEENERQVEAFLDRHSDFHLEPPPDFDARLTDEHGRLRILPHVHGFDGAFAARLRRRNGRAG